METLFAGIGAVTGVILVFLEIQKHKKNQKKSDVTMEGCVSPVSTSMSHIEKESIKWY